MHPSHERMYLYVCNLEWERMYVYMYMYISIERYTTVKWKIPTAKANWPIILIVQNNSSIQYQFQPTTVTA